MADYKMSPEQAVFRLAYVVKQSAAKLRRGDAILYGEGVREAERLELRFKELCDALRTWQPFAELNDEGH